MYAFQLTESGSECNSLISLLALVISDLLVVSEHDDVGSLISSAPV